MEFERVFRNIAEISKKPVVRATLALAIGTTSSYACIEPTQQSGYVVEKLPHDEEHRWDGTMLSSRQDCDFGIDPDTGDPEVDCNTVYYEVPATIIDDEDWMILIRPCDQAEEGLCKKDTVTYFVDKKTYDSTKEETFVDWTNNRSVSENDPTRSIRRY